VADGVRRDGWMNSAKFRITTPIRNYKAAVSTERTLQNVKDSDGTVVVYPGELRGGTEQTFASVLT